MGKVQKPNNSDWIVDVINKNQNKLRGLQPASKLYRLNDRHLPVKFNANFCGQKGVAWLARRIPYGL
jgi:hypothetical protein